MTYEYYLETDRKLIGSYSGVQYAETDCIMKCIQDLIKKNKTTYYIEIGVLYGGLFKNVLCQYHNRIIPIGIDLFEDFQVSPDNTHGGNVTSKHFLEEILKENGFSNFTLIKGDSTIIVPALEPMECCCCFIDGNHSYEGCKTDFENIYKKMDHGYILFHDSQFSEVNQVVTEALQYPDIVNHGQIWSVRILSKNL